MVEMLAVQLQILSSYGNREKGKESPGWWWVPVIPAVGRLGVSRVVPYTPLGGSTNDNTRSPHKAAEAFLCPVAWHVGICFSNKQRH